MSRVERTRPPIVNVLLPDTHDHESQEGVVICDLCKKFYSEWYCQDEEMNFCIWCNKTWHEPIGKMNHVRLAIDGRPVFKGSTPNPSNATSPTHDGEPGNAGGDAGVVNMRGSYGEADAFAALDAEVDSERSGDAFGALDADTAAAGGEEGY